MVVYKMVIHVKDDEADLLVRKLARSRGIGITEAIKEATKEALAADAAEAKVVDVPLRMRLQPLLDRLDRLPRGGLATDKEFFDELWGEES